MTALDTGTIAPEARVAREVTTEAGGGGAARDIEVTTTTGGARGAGMVARLAERAGCQDKKTRTAAGPLAATRATRPAMPIPATRLPGAARCRGAVDPSSRTAASLAQTISSTRTTTPFSRRRRRGRVRRGSKLSRVVSNNPTTTLSKVRCFGASPLPSSTFAKSSLPGSTSVDLRLFELWSASFLIRRSSQQLRSASSARLRSSSGSSCATALPSAVRCSEPAAVLSQRWTPRLGASSFSRLPSPTPAAIPATSVRSRLLSSIRQPPSLRLRTSNLATSAAAAASLLEQCSYRSNARHERSPTFSRTPSSRSSSDILPSSSSSRLLRAPS